MRFADIPGHDDIKRRLVEMADTARLPHALLLEGPSGTGKFMLARALAQYIHCENPSHGDCCATCPSCRQHETFNHIDTVFSYPVVKKAGKPAVSADYLPEFKSLLTEHPFMDPEQWVSLLQAGNTQPKIYVDEGAELTRRLNFRAHQSRYKIVLLWLPEKMNEDTANKMLKIIEEPHDDTLFLLISNNPRQILPTIYSRTQRIAVNRYDDEEVSDWLRDNMAMAPEAADSIARISSGNINEAVSLTRISKTRKMFLDLFIDLMRKAYQRKIGLLRQWSVDAASLGREQSLAFLNYCARMMRENFILNLHVSGLNYLTPDEKAFSVNFSRFINERNVLKLFDVVNDARNDIAGNANAKIVFFDLAIKTILLLKK
jgi:DNA polymerase-3 subunit delta'